MFTWQVHLGLFLMCEAACIFIHMTDPISDVKELPIAMYAAVFFFLFFEVLAWATYLISFAFY